MIHRSHRAGFEGRGGPELASTAVRNASSIKDSSGLQFANERNLSRFFLQAHDELRVGRLAESQMTFHTIDLSAF